MKLVLVAISLGFALGTALVALDLKTSLEKVEHDRDFYANRYNECFARCGP